MAYTGPDETSKQLLDRHTENVSAYSKIAAQLAAAEGDRDKAVQSWMESASDAQVVKLRTQIETLRNKMLELAEKAVGEQVTLSEDVKAKLVAERDELKGKIKSGINVINQVAETFNIDLEGVKAALTEIGNPTSSGRGRPAGSAGSTLPRVSVNVTLTSSAAPDKPQEFETMSAAATTLENMELKEFQERFAKAAGVPHSNIKNVNEPVEFQVKTSSGTVWTVQTTPKEREKPGPKTTKAEGIR